MAHEQDAISVRVGQLERQVRTLKAVAAAAVVLAVALATISRPQAQQPPDTLRVRKLIVEDGTGRERVVLGYLDAPGNNRRIGLRINDPAGVERFGLSFIDNGSLVMGFDAPPGTGVDANRERINISTDANGGAYLRFLDRRTNVVSRMYLDDQNQVWMQFSDFTRTPALIRRYGLAGEQLIEPKPQ
jgi:hypothetical protein